MPQIGENKNLFQLYDLIPLKSLVKEFSSLIVEEELSRVRKDVFDVEISLKFNTYQLMNYTHPLLPNLKIEKQSLITLNGDILGEYNEDKEIFVVETVIPHSAVFASLQTDTSTKVYFSQYGQTWGLKYV